MPSAGAIPASAPRTTTRQLQQPRNEPRRFAYSLLGRRDRAGPGDEGVDVLGACQVRGVPSNGCFYRNPTGTDHHNPVDDSSNKLAPSCLPAQQVRKMVLQSQTASKE